MTLILGLKYDFGRGLLIMSDSMITNVDGSLDTQKIHYGFDKQCIVTGSGMGPILDRIISKFDEKFESLGNRVSSFRDVLDLYEDIANDTVKRYKKYDSMNEEDESSMFRMMFGIWNYKSDRPELFVIGNACIASKTEQYEAIGSGASVALNILRKQWNENLSIDQCMRLAAYCVMKASEYVNTVCPPIQLGIIQDKQMTILNYDENDNFVMDNLQSRLLEEDAEKTIKNEDESIKKWIYGLDGKNQIIPYRSK